MNSTPSNKHSWRFFRAGGFDQVRLDQGSDLIHLDQLDQKLWVALACPTSGLEFDASTLALIDTDKDGRIRAPELIAAAKWAGSMLKNPDDLLKGTATISLSAINDANEEGQQLLASARQILTNLGKAQATEISLADVTDTSRIFAQTDSNGDGILPPEAGKDEATRSVLGDIINCVGGDTDRSGKPGISQAKVDQFFMELQAYSDWYAKAKSDPALLVLGANTGSAAAALHAVRAKINDYFARCRLAAYDPRALPALNREEREYLAIAAKDLSITAQELSGFPLARIQAGQPLPLMGAVNPAWTGALATFHAQVVIPLIGDKPALTESDWETVIGKLAPYEAWVAAKSGAAVESLGLARIREILTGPQKETITALIAQDKALEPQFNSIATLEKLLRYHRNLHRLCCNFVNFSDFYSRREKAVFQAGTLFLDTRSCDLCLRIQDLARHGSMAALGGTYLAYCDCVRKSTGEKMTIAAAFTGGDSDDLMVGRNGVFYDRQNRDWDATITKIIDNPISIRQAFWTPYKKLVRMIEEQVAKRAAAADTAATDKLAATAATTANLDKAKPEDLKKGPTKFDTGTVAALGVALGSLATAAGVIFTKLADIAPWKVLFVVIAVCLAISLPSVIMAALKLRKRSLGPLLDGNGWAVNAKARMNIPFGGSLTATAALPPGAMRDLTDPFAEKRHPWKMYLTLLILVALGIGWWQGRLDKNLPASLRSTTVLGTNAPAYQPAPQSVEPATKPPSP